MGNLALAAALPLSIGSGIGAFGGGQIAVRSPARLSHAAARLLHSFCGSAIDPRCQVCSLYLTRALTHHLSPPPPRPHPRYGCQRSPSKYSSLCSSHGWAPASCALFTTSRKFGSEACPPLACVASRQWAPSFAHKGGNFTLPPNSGPISTQSLASLEAVHGAALVFAQGRIFHFRRWTYSKKLSTSTRCHAVNSLPWVL